METIRKGLTDVHAAHQFLMALWVAIKPDLLAGNKLHIEVRSEKRSDPQNRRMWAMLKDISRQVIWHGQKMSDDEWKDFFTAALKKQRVMPGMDGGFVVLGQKTSKMSKAEMCELQELIEAFGAQHEVRFAAQDCVA